jgi:fumarate hydratase class II
MAITDTNEHRATNGVHRAQPAEAEGEHDRSVMMVTALSPIIGYDRASVISY